MARSLVIRLQSMPFGADPEMAFLIGKKTTDIIGHETITIRGIGGMMDKDLFLPVKHGQPGAPDGQPEIAVRIFGNILHGIAGQAAAVAGLGFIDREAITVVFVQSVAGAEPHEAAAFLVDTDHVALGEAGFRSQVPELKMMLLWQGSMIER